MWCLCRRVRQSSGNKKKKRNRMEARKTSVRNGPRARGVGVLVLFFGMLTPFFGGFFFWGGLICVVCETR